MKLIPLLVSLVPLTTLTLASPTPNRSKRALTTSSAASLDASYDYIIVGGGLAGSVLARRLASSDRNVKILLIEAGSDQESNPNVYEAGKYQSTFDTPLDYAYATVPQRSQGSKAIRAGKMLGGSTGINGLAWTKPHSFQIDALEQVGNQGVDWNLLNGYMRSAERFSPPGSAYLAEEGCHGTQGPITVQYDRASSPLAFETRFNQTVVQSEGLRFAGDLTCGNPEGAGQVANTRDGDVRITSYRGYLYNQDLPGLTILTDTQVGKITFSSLRATGVEFQSSGSTRTIRASSEIIMAAGSIGTPKILQHSGIGPQSVLSSAGVPTMLDLPVGMGLVDQVTTTTNWQFGEERGGGQVILFPNFDELFQGDEADRMRSILENDLAGYASAAQDAGAVPNGDALLKVLEIQRDWILNRNAGIAESFDYSYSSGGSVNTLGYDSWYLLPFGRGSVKITNSDAYDTAALSIDPRYFSTEFDRLAQAAITRFTRTVSRAQPLASVVQSEGTPGDQVPEGASLDEWADWSERNYRSNWHPIGTVGMMSRDMGGCVGSDYKLYGVEGLRVVDGSILPFQVSSHLMSVLYGLAERAAEVILADYQPGSGGVGNETTPVVPPTPPASGGGKSIHPNGDTTKCLAVGGALADGAPVQIGNCDGSASQSWTIERGSTIIQVKGTHYCFDSGDSPSNGALAKIWTCYQGIPAQTWWLTDAGDDHIALQDSGLCLDLPDGDKTAGKRLQLWECAGQNNNQKWTLS